MIAYQKEKVENAICFFAYEHKKKTRQPLYQTSLYKYLAFLDFEILEETGQPALGLKYRAMEKGPVPDEIYKDRAHLKTECYAFKPVGEGKYIIASRGKPNLNYFSPHEIKKMQELIEIYADRFVKAADMSEASHQEIRAWERAYKKKPNSIIDYTLQFDDDLLSKPEKDLTFPEETYLTYQAFESLSK